MMTGGDGGGGRVKCVCRGGHVPVIGVGDDKLPANFLEPCHRCDVARQPVMTVEQSQSSCPTFGKKN